MAAGVSFPRHRRWHFLVSLAVALPVAAGLVTGVAPANAAVRPPVAAKTGRPVPVHRVARQAVRVPVMHPNRCRL
jgi:hypothetical protein